MLARPSFALSRLWLSLLLLTAAGASGCGGAAYQAQMMQTASEIKAGRRPGGSAAPAAGSSAIAPTNDPRLFPSSYEIHDSAGTPTGIKIYLPKEFVNPDGSANFTNTETLGGVRLAPAGNQTSLMAHFYMDTSGKKYPAILTFTRLPAGKIANAEQRQQAENAMIMAAPKVATPGSPAPTFSDFPTASGNLRKMSYLQRSAFPVGDANGPKEEVDSRVDTYVLMTTGEGILFQAIAPASVTNTFDFFGAIEAGLKAMQAGPPAVTGTIP